MKRGLVLVAMLAAGLSGEDFARRGNSEEQLAALLGKPTEIGKPDSDGLSMNTYESRYYIALVQFVTGYSIAEAYNRKDHGKFPEKGSLIFIDGNSAGNKMEQKPVEGREVVTCKSPDGKFALRHVYNDQQPYTGDTAIIEVATRKVILPLDSNWSIEGTAEHPHLQNGELKLLWSPDSQRVAYFAENGNDLATRVFFRSGSSFNEMKLPELPSPKLPATATTESDTDTTKRVEPMQWLKSGDLVLESEVLSDAWGRAASKITIGFDQENRASIRKAEQEKMSIVDYFLLLPANLFEDGSPSRLLQQTRTGGGQLYLCDAEPREKYVDEQNGYMTCGGDGAQSPLEVALFRHRDGRPLLAVCSGDLEEFNSIYLHFFELGDDGKMHEIKRSIFPIADSRFEAEKDKPNWQFDLPREGRTILVRAPKSGKILHKVTWTGEKFAEQK